MSKRTLTLKPEFLASMMKIVEDAERDNDYLDFRGDDEAMREFLENGIIPDWARTRR